MKKQKPSPTPAPAPARKRVPLKTTAVAQAIRRLLRDRGADKTICPSEVARAIAPTGWRAHMGRVREEAARMVTRGEIVFTQRGTRVDPATARGPIRLARGDIDRTKYADAYRGVDFRARPDLYRVGRGEQGVLIAEPYKSELLPLWRFRTEEIARESARALWKAFLAYRRANDFVGMDMARKYLQMGFTRARRYANHRSGRKWAARDVALPRKARELLPITGDGQKAKAAQVFYEYWQKAEGDRSYAAWRRRARDSDTSVSSVAHIVRAKPGA